MQSFFKKLPRYSLRLLLAYLVYIFTGGVLAYLLPRQARNLPQTDSFYGIGRGPDRAVLVEEPQDAFARRVEVIRTAQSTLDEMCIRDRSRAYSKPEGGPYRCVQTTACAETANIAAACARYWDLDVYKRQPVYSLL